jgi:hypothetical protein
VRACTTSGESPSVAKVVVIRCLVLLSSRRLWVVLQGDSDERRAHFDAALENDGER